MAILFDPGNNDSHWDILQKITQVEPKTGMVLRSDVTSRDDDTKLLEIDPEDTAVVLQT